MISLKTTVSRTSIFLLRFVLIFTISAVTFSCDDSDDNKEVATCSDGILNQDETEIDCGGVCDECPTCSDGILNQDETEIDCGGVCDECPEIFTLEEGTYQLFWNSTTDTGKSFTGTSASFTTLSAAGENKFEGRFFWRNHVNGPSFNIGSITVTLDGNDATFQFIETPQCVGEFNGTGVLQENNRIKFDITGTDCDGNHIGTVELVLEDQI